MVTVTCKAHKSVEDLPSKTASMMTASMMTASMMTEPADDM